MLPMPSAPSPRPAEVRRSRSVRCPDCRAELSIQKSQAEHPSCGPVVRRYYRCPANEKHPEYSFRFSTVERIDASSKIPVDNHRTRNEIRD